MRHHLPRSWVDALFERLTVRYGVAFTRQYADLSMDTVKADWAEALGGLSGDAVRHGLDCLSATPPNANQFRDLCRRAPESFQPMIEAPKPAPERVTAALSKIGASPAAEHPTVACIRNIERAAARRPLTASQRWVLQQCLVARGDAA